MRIGKNQDYNFYIDAFKMHSFCQSLRFVLCYVLRFAQRIMDRSTKLIKDFCNHKYRDINTQNQRSRQVIFFFLSS